MTQTTADRSVASAVDVLRRIVSNEIVRTSTIDIERCLYGNMIQMSQAAAEQLLAEISAPAPAPVGSGENKTDDRKIVVDIGPAYEALMASPELCEEMNKLVGGPALANALKENEHLTAQIAALKEALEKSVQLQSHYAQILNDYDGGKRLQFKSADEWLARAALKDTQR